MPEQPGDPLAGTSISSVEPGDYVLRVYRQDDERSALEERVRVDAGHTVDVNFDMSGNEDETEELGDGAGGEADDDLAETAEAP